jgi:hypothetical protein
MGRTTIAIAHEAKDALDREELGPARILADLVAISHLRFNQIRGRQPHRRALVSSR